MSNDYRIKETIHTGGFSQWTVEVNACPNGHSLEDHWKPLANCETKKEAVALIEMKRGTVVIDTQYHEVP
jgi:hypothetical protein